MLNKNMVREVLISKLFLHAILKILIEKGELHPYLISRELQQYFKISIIDSNLYPALYTLEGNGFITSEQLLIGNRYRKYFKIVLLPKSTIL